MIIAGDERKETTNDTQRPEIEIEAETETETETGVSGATSTSSVPPLGVVLSVGGGDGDGDGNTQEVEVELLAPMPAAYREESDEEDTLLLVESGQVVQNISANNVVVIEEWTYGERKIMDRIEDPHGEHAHGFYEVIIPEEHDET